MLTAHMASSVHRRAGKTEAPSRARASDSRRVRRSGVVSPGAAARGARKTPVEEADDKASTSARKAILDAAVAALEHHGESTIRISEIARRAGVAVGLIYYHFADREGLVSAAQIERMIRTPADDVNLLEAAVRLTDDPGQFARMLTRIVGDAMASERAPVRLDRVAILGASKGRPGFTATLSRAIAAQTDRLAAIIGQSQVRGMIHPSVDARSMAILVQAFSVGLVIADLDEKPVDRAKLLDVFMLAIGGLGGPTSAKTPAKRSPSSRRGRPAANAPRRRR